MANKVSIFITNTQGESFEYCNSKMSLSIVKDLNVNLQNVYPNKKFSPYDIVLIDFTNNTGCIYGTSFFIIHNSSNEKESEEIIEKCRAMLHSRYELMMMIRIAKKRKLNQEKISKLEYDFYNKDNYELNLNSFLKQKNKKTIK